MLEHLSIYTYLFFGITFSISMYIMCVCLFSALSRRVGALQISIIIIIIIIKREKEGEREMQTVLGDKEGKMEWEDEDMEERKETDI